MNITLLVYSGEAVDHLQCILFLCTRGVDSGNRVGFRHVSFGLVVFRIGYFSVARYAGSGRLATVWLKIGYSSYRVSIGSMLVEIRVECQSLSSCHRLIIGLVLSGIDQV